MIARPTQERTTLGWMLVLLLLAATAAGIWFVFKSPLPPTQVFLKAPPESDQVQMFNQIGVLDKDASHFFPDRTICTVIESRIRYVAAGIPLEFYKLDCGGTIGYVNSRWVSRY